MPVTERADLGFDLDDAFEAAFEARRTQDARHKEPGEDGRWCWHASQLANCTRQLMLIRAGMATDGFRLDSLCTFALGDNFHQLLAEGAPLIRREGYEHIASEPYYRHPTLNLAGELDLIYVFRGAVVVVDLKSEGATCRYCKKGARTYRYSDTEGQPSRAKPEHISQIGAYAVLVEQAHGFRPTEGMVVYLDKGTGERDYQHFDITDELVGWVSERVAELDAAWEQWENERLLPDRLPPEPDTRKSAKPGDVRPPWRCQQRSAHDERGLWCPARVSCMSLPD